MTRLYLVRHGRPAQHYGVGDASLSDFGRRQAEDAAISLAGQGALRVISSPTKRCRETAEPIAKALRQSVSIEQRISEVPAPKGVADPAQWVREHFNRENKKTWSSVDPRVNAWREDVLKAIRDIKHDSVVVTHFVVINVVMGAALQLDEMVVCAPDHASITEFALVGGDLRFVLDGDQIASDAG
jgi:broad specificity phosphatase PhoE